MKFGTLPRVRSVKSYLLCHLLVSLTLLLAVGAQTALAQAQLTLGDIITALRSRKVTLAERNQLLTEGVRERGITFSLLPEIEKELRTLGASNELLDAIRQKSPAVKPAPPRPEPTATPPDFTFYQNRANAEFIRGEYDEAVVDYSKAIELNARDATVFLFRGMAYFHRKNYELAINDYTRAIELDPKESMNYFNRGNSYEKLGNLQRAFLDFQKAVEIDKDNDLAKASLLRVQIELAKAEMAAQQKNSANTAQITTPNLPPSPTPENAPNGAQNNSPNDPPNTAVNNTTNTVSGPAPNNSAGGDTNAAVTPNTAPDKEAGSQPAGPPLVSLGSLMNLAVRLATPVYPPLERQRNVEGLVTVEIMLDEEGKVLSARATAGPQTLRAVSENAARKTKFRPPTFNGKPVRATGFIVYNFKANPN